MFPGDLGMEGNLDRNSLCLFGRLRPLEIPASAAVPQLINYQGRVAVGGVNFDGTGQFKFALVDGGVDLSEQATATAVNTSGFITSVNVDNGGAGYVVAPAVGFSGGGGAGAAAHAVVSSGVVTGIVVDNPGSGYVSAPAVIIDPPPAGSLYITYWSNDGTSTAGSEPADAVDLSVAKGLYSVLLGDATLANMSTVPSTVFTNENVHLRVWFDDGSNGSQLLTPDQRIAAVGYAMMAGEAQTVPDGAITSAKLASGAVGSAQLASGAVGSTHLASGAVTDALNAEGQGGVAGGAIILSATENTALLNAGYVRIGATAIAGGWLERESDTAPAARRYHTAVWTGSEMIVWGGYNGSYLNTGGRYDPAANSWTETPTTWAPVARINHKAVWTGSEMIVWGGSSGSPVNTGGRYDPVANSWTATTTASAPAARRYHTAIWTGSEMIVWGGLGSLNTGGRYDPAANSWTATTTNSAPTGRYDHTAVWTGSEMIVWGGNGYLNTGGRYDPAINTWTATTTTVAPDGRRDHTAVWTGSEMIVWGGYDGSYLNTGGHYDPTLDSWTAAPTTVVLDGRRDHTAVWTGSEMIVWGGKNISTDLNTGGRYDPVANRWITTEITTSVPDGRRDHTAVWTGSEMIVWGGYTTSGVGYLNDIWSYTPGKTLILYQWPGVGLWKETWRGTRYVCLAG